MEKKRETRLLLRTCNCDMYGSWRPSAILEAMQETAGEHSALCGLTTPVMTEMGLAWVVSRVKVQMQRLPKVGETVCIETYPTPNRHMFFPRTHIFRDGEGNVLGSANSLWMLMDIQSRRVTQSSEVIARLPDNSDLKPALGLPATVRRLEAEAEQKVFQPAFTDFDTNLHVNNTKYLDWCLNALGHERLADQCLKSFDVNYDAEILPGTEVRTELKLQENRFSFFGFAGDKQHFAVSGTLEARE